MTDRSTSLMAQYRQASAEADLLLSMILLEMDPHQKIADHISNLLDVGIIDWSHFIRLALGNEMLPIAHPTLKVFDTHTIPDDVSAYLQNRFERNVRRNKALCQELVMLNDLFASNGITIINYKGPETTARAGIDITRRQFNDLDFLVRPDQMAAISEVLSTIGYIPKIDPTTPENYWRKDCSFIRTHASDGKKAIASLPGDPEEYREIIIEPHVSITEFRLPLALDYQGIWNRVQSIEFSDTILPSLSPEDLLFILCICGCKAKWKNLKLICHIANTIHALPEIDFDVCMKRARGAGCERMLLLGLMLASDFLGADIPLHIVDRARSERALTTHAKNVVYHRSRPCDASSWLPHFPARFSLLVMQTLDRPQDRFQYLWSTMTLPRRTHYERIPLPRSLHGFYRIIVPLYDYVILPSIKLVRIFGRRILRGGTWH